VDCANCQFTIEVSKENPEKWFFDGFYPLPVTETKLN